MTPKEKAEELVLKFKQLPEEDTLAWYLSFELSKKCALLAVDEMINMAVQYEGALSPFKISNYPEFLKEVKQEIEKLV